MARSKRAALTSWLRPTIESIADWKAITHALPVSWGLCPRREYEVFQLISPLQTRRPSLGPRQRHACEGLVRVIT